MPRTPVKSKRKAFKLAKKAGFVAYTKEERESYGHSVIDWSSDYDDNLLTLVRLVELRTLECAIKAAKGNKKDIIKELEDMRQNILVSTLI